MTSVADIQLGSSYLPVRPSGCMQISKPEDSKGTLTGLSSWGRNAKLAEDFEGDHDEYLRDQQLRLLCGIGSIDIGNSKTDLSYRRNSVGVHMVRDPQHGRTSASTLDTNQANTHKMYSASKTTNKSEQPTIAQEVNNTLGPIGARGPGLKFSFISGETTSNNSSARAMLSKGGLVGHLDPEIKAQTATQVLEEVPDSVKKAKAESTPSRYQNTESFQLTGMHNWSQKKHPKLEKVHDASHQGGQQNFTRASRLFENISHDEPRPAPHGRHSFLRQEVPSDLAPQMHQSFIGHNKHNRRFTQGYDEFRMSLGKYEDDDYFQQSERKPKHGRPQETRIRTEESQTLLNSSMNNFSRKRTQPVFESDQYRIIKERVVIVIIEGAK